MEKGKIIEEGTHQSLLGKNGNYGKLYEQYYKHQKLD
jgi:ABC-type multidrug transport system fused ATPase/permease subunit